MTDVTKTDLCNEVEDHLAEILDGQAPETLIDHLADCDHCRDLRHDAERARELAGAAGADYVAPSDLEERVLAALDGGKRPVEVSLNRTLESGTDAPAPTAVDAHPTTLDVHPTVLDVQPTETDLHPTETDVPAPRTEPLAAPQTPAEPPKPQPVQPAVVAGKKSPAVQALQRKPRLVAGAIAAILVAAAAALVVKLGDPKVSGGGSQAGWSGKLTKVSSAEGGSKGVELCDADGKSCAPVAGGATVPAGARLKTDEHTRAYLELGDGSRMVLDRGTDLALASGKSRQARLERGAIVADVAHQENQTARIELPRGSVEVLGTKFALRAVEGSAAVDVSRGSVRLLDAESREVVVRAGEQGRLHAGMPPYASSAPALGSSFAWSEAAVAEAGEETRARGLGELKAKKPGKDAELDRAVTLTSHKVKVRIAGAVARTEVDETFTNHTDDVLEGIFRFPMPPDAKIERLALEVDGKLIDGAFVERDRAAAIWRGAIVTAAPQLRRQIREEIVWVPGPWKDPALLEWQRGGRFELRIYPIPKRGARRVVLAYSQLIQPTGGVRRYNYPLAHDPSGSTRVDDFQADVEVRGHDEKFGVSAQGYELTRSASAGVSSLKLSQRSFIPSGDLTLEYALPQRDAELTVWAYKPSAGELEAAHRPAAKPGDAQGKSTAEPAKLAAQPVAPGAQASDSYVAIALRPKLPRTSEDAHRAFVVMVDSSRSMFGESYIRATRVATRLVRELDPLDRVTVLACDTDCRALPGGLVAPSAQVAADTERFLAGIAPEGASDPTAAVQNALAAAGNIGDRSLKLIYVGDGSPTVGPIRQAYVARAVEDALPPGRGTLTAVAIGADSDLDTLSALARGGGGVVLPFVPGQNTAEVAFAVLGATYGNALRDVAIELPDGLAEVSPKRLDTIPAGGESLVVARMAKSELKGNVVVRGKLGKQSFEQRYAVQIAPSASKGNAFVPRLYAGARIADLEREADAQAKQRAVELSQAFNVASRHTSLLVLESAAMFRAFGLDNTQHAPQWTGEQAADLTTAEGEIGVEGAGKDKASDPAEPEASNPFDGDEGSLSGLSGAGRGAGSTPSQDIALSEQPASARRPQRASASRPAPKAASPAGPPPAPAAERPAMPAPAEEAKKSEAPRSRGETLFSGRDDSEPRPAPRPAATIAEPFPNNRPGDSRWPGRRMIPMRRIWERVGSVDIGRLVPPGAAQTAIAEAEALVARDENRREAVKKLYALYALAGDMEQANRTAERWSNKEPLDPEALTARADLAARGGDRELAIRILGSVVDVRPSDIKAQTRLARLHRWAGRAAQGCRHTLAIAQLRSSDATLLADAVRCGRQTGASRMAEDMLLASDAKTRKAADLLLAKADVTREELSGDLRVEATWSGQQDIDLALIDPDGNRISWLGAPTRAVISARDVTSSSSEGLALRGGKPGVYLVEVVRGAPGGRVQGELTLNVAGTRRSVPFVLDDNRATIALAKINMQSRLVPF